VTEKEPLVFADFQEMDEYTLARDLVWWRRDMTGSVVRVMQGAGMLVRAELRSDAGKVPYYLGPLAVYFVVRYALLDRTPRMDVDTLVRALRAKDEVWQRLCIELALRGDLDEGEDGG
jgi:hypothetical protein